MKIFVDYDSTLVDLIDGWLKWIKKTHGHKIKTEQITEWNWLSNTHGEAMNDYWKINGVYNRDVKPISGAVMFMDALRNLYGEESVFIISASHCGMENEKAEHAKKHFGIDPGYFMHKHEKYRYTSDGILIDDAPHYIAQHIRANEKPGILFNYRNRYGWAYLPGNPLLMRASSYAEALQQVNVFADEQKEIDNYRDM